MNLSRLRWLLQKKQLTLCLTTHARIEAIKDGLTATDLRNTLEQGEEIEDSPNRARALLLGWTKDQLPCHVVVEWEMTTSQVIVVSAYLPDGREWRPDWKRRRRRRRQ